MKQDRTALMASWRQRLALDGAANEGNLESTEQVVSADDRIRMARDEMRRLIKENFGGDAALLGAVAKIEITGIEAVKVLEAGRREPDAEEFSSLEAIVAFDGTRPSFLLKEDHIDFESSFSTSEWKTTLAPRAEELAAFSACVGRVESDGMAIGTAFLVSPTLAITNRHVAQAIAGFDGESIAVHDNIQLNFGGEHRGRAVHDRRDVRRVVFTGVDLVAPPIDHGKLDLALLEVSASSLPGDAAGRHLTLRTEAGDIPQGWVVATVGYPGDWRRFTPAALQTEHEAVLARLLEGDGGSKRLAPGSSAGMLAPVADDPKWTTTHDATTINGNSGSPLVIVRGGGPFKAAGLHYGGQWKGDRTNWAHVLARCGEAKVMPGGAGLREALAGLGVEV